MTSLPLGERQLNTLDAPTRGKPSVLLASLKPTQQQKQDSGRDVSGGGAAAAGSSQPASSHMPEEDLSTMLDLCLRLAAENRITDKNVWALPLIDHLPDIVHSAAQGTAVNFGKMSSGLDAGVQIYSKRVEQTWKAAHHSLFGIDKSDNKDGDAAAEGADEDAGSDAEEGVTGTQREAKATAAAARRAKAHAAEGRASDTLVSPEDLQMKQMDTSFQIDPLFHHMSSKFDQGGAAGLLQLHCRVYGGSYMMTDPHQSPEACFTGQPQPDMLVDVGATAARLRALCGQVAEGVVATAITPGMDQLMGLAGLPGGQQLAQEAQQLVQGVMDEVFANNRAYTHIAAATGAPAAGGSCMSLGPVAGAAAVLPMDGDQSMEEPLGSSPGPLGAADPSQDDLGAAGGAATMEEGDPAAADDPVMAAFAAACVTQEEPSDATGGMDYSAAAGDYDDGYDGDGGCEEQEEGAQVHVARSAAGGVLPVVGIAAAASSSTQAAGLDPMSWLRALDTSSSSWPGSGSLKRSAASKGVRAAAAAKRARGAKPGTARLDFTDMQELPPEAFAKGTKARINLSSSAAPAPTLRPQHTRYEAATFGHLFCNPGVPASYYTPSAAAAAAGGAGLAGPYSTPGRREYTTELDMEAAADTSMGGEGGSWAPWDDGGDDDGNGGGWGGSVGEFPGEGLGGLAAPWQQGAGGLGQEGGGGEEEEEEEEEAAGYQLLRVAHRVETVGINYSRSAKQVDVRALKDVIWDKLTLVNQLQQQATGATGTPTAAGAQPIRFQQVLQQVPEVSTAGPLEELSVHMCFICLLHLANEQGLAIRSTSDLAGLMITGGLHTSG